MNRSMPVSLAARVFLVVVLITLGLFVPPPAKAQSTTNTWTTTGSMTTARIYHTATMLPNGKVLVAGGSEWSETSGHVSLSTAELYDPASGTWAATGSMTMSRSGHTATLLPDGKVLVTGGAADSRSVELYDPTSGTWSTTDSMAADKFGSTAMLLPNGKLLVTGCDLSWEWFIAELFDPSSGTWTKINRLPRHCGYPEATLLPDGKVLVSGGTYDQSSLSGASLYDPSSGTWVGGSWMTISRNGHTATLLSNGKVLVTGGANEIPDHGLGGMATAELFDQASMTCTAIGSMAAARVGHSATLLPSGQVLVVGGLNIHNSPLYLSSAELYDPASGTWSTAGSMATVRDSHTATLLPSGQVLVVGGRNGSDMLSSAEIYTLSTMWTSYLPVITR